ncbi:MAG: RNA 2',3'-cyclic phosphodiesterase [Hyphomonadaceae bacterium]
MPLRLFAAVPLPQEIRARLATLQHDVPGARWRPQENMHLTLRFFGEIDEPLARELDYELGDIVAAPFELSLKGIGSFGRSEPSVLWAGVEAPEALKRLAAACERAARAAGLQPEARIFRPHVTLAHGRAMTDVDAAAYCERNGGFRTEPFWADHFALYSSWVSKGSRRYVEEAVYPLEGAPRIA